jgi:hypothetical protein
LAKLTRAIEWLLLAGLLCVVGCSSVRGVEKQVGQYIEKQCAGQFPCRVRLRDATTFAWDEMYIFDYSSTQSRVEEMIGTKVPDFRPRGLYRHLIFMKDGKVVLSEDEKVDFDGTIPDQLVFDDGFDAVDYHWFGSDTAFMASREQGDTGRFYLLKSIKATH